MIPGKPLKQLLVEAEVINKKTEKDWKVFKKFIENQQKTMVSCFLRSLFKL